MVKIVESKWLGVTIRSEDWDELGVSTWVKIKEAIQEGRKQEALDLVDYLSIESYLVHHIMPNWTYYLLTYLADNYGEGKVYETMRESGELLRRGAIEAAAKMPVEELVRVNAQTQRAHRCGPGELGNITITEDDEKYVISFDPCGSGGSMRRTRELDKTPAMTGPPYNLGKTKKPYPWSWSKAGVPYYCTHCCIWSEILPTEYIGYPLRVCFYNDDPEKPCAWAFYKNPELIPKEYFTRIGRVKDPSKFKNSVKQKSGC